MARGLIIAAPNSGAGKTTITLGLISALTSAGQKVRPFKTGPDYIDPTYLSAAAGAPCANLDPWAMRRETISRLIGGVKPDEVAIVEGVMGLHDGPGSTAALSRISGWPIILVVDASKSAQTAAAVAEGLVLRDPDLAISGVIFNRVASKRHEALIREALHSDIPSWFLPPEDSLVLPSRHLGLHMADENSDLNRFLLKASEWANPLVEISHLANESVLKPETPMTFSSIGHPDLGLCFSYPHMQVPEQSIFLPGGYPELYLDKIKSDQHFLPNLRQAAEAGVPIYGECGGFMVLGEAIIDAQGVRHQMAGLLPLVTTFAKKKRHLGYREIRALTNFSLGSEGEIWRGHEFHYTRIEWQGEAEALFEVNDAYGSSQGLQGLKVGTVAGSYLHLIDIYSSS